MKQPLFVLLAIGFCLLYSCNAGTPDAKRNVDDIKAETISLKKESANKAFDDDFKVYNDPAVRKITIEFDSEEPATALLNVYFSDGRLLNRKQVTVNTGINTWEYNFPPHATGIYWVRFITSTLERSAKVFKKVAK